MENFRTQNQRKFPFTGSQETFRENVLKKYIEKSIRIRRHQIGEKFHFYPEKRTRCSRGSVTPRTERSIRINNRYQNNPKKGRHYRYYCQAISARRMHCIQLGYKTIFQLFHKIQIFDFSNQILSSIEKISVLSRKIYFSLIHPQTRPQLIFEIV